MTLMSQFKPNPGECGITFLGCESGGCGFASACDANLALALEYLARPSTQRIDEAYFEHSAASYEKKGCSIAQLVLAAALRRLGEITKT